MKVLNFRGLKYKLEPFPYPSGRIGIMMVNVDDDSQKLAATLDIPGVKILNNEIIVKNHDLNTGLLDVLIDLEIIDKQVKPITLGFNKVYLAKLNVKEWISQT